MYREGCILKKKHVLAIASAGGHWVQLQRMRPAWDGCQVSYVTTKSGYLAQVQTDAKKRQQSEPGYYTVTDANRWQKLRLIRQILEIFFLLVRLRPDVIISTGAAPGFFALKFGKIFGAKTIWVDSIANAEELSLSGQKVRSAADLWLTQWEQLSGEEPEKPNYAGSVI
ncbi:MAG: UDP-N-acetylglucosamine:LPS N-acetylglucosamine transferase [Sneathiella sp.]